MLKTLTKVGIKGNISQHNKDHIWQTQDNIILNGEKLNSFPLKSETRQGWPLSPVLFNILLAVLVMAIRKKIECIQIVREEVKLSLFANDMILYRENSKVYTKITLRTNKWIQSIYRIWG